jgi:colicin import membrane protein
MSLLAECQITELAALVLEIVPPGSEMMENFEEMLRIKIDEKARVKYAPERPGYLGTYVNPTSDQLKLVEYDLPFMPRCVKYVGCKAIKYSGGLMTPCGGKVKNSEFCNACAKKAADKGSHEFGTLDEREDAHDKGEKYTAGGKTEKSYGDFLEAKKLKLETVKAAIRAAGLSLNIPAECLERTVSDKKRAGRPKKADAAANEDEVEEVAEAPKPKVKKAPLTLEEKIEQVKQKAAEQERKNAEREAQRIAKAEQKAKDDAEKALKKAAKEQEKAAKAATTEEKGKKKKATAEEVSQLLGSLQESDEKEENEDGSLDGSDEEEEEEKYISKTVKGVDLVYSDKTKKVYADGDDEHTTAVGEYLPDKKTVSFYTTKAARTIIEEQLEGEITKYNADNEHETMFFINGKIHLFNHETKTLAVKKTGEVLWVLNDDGKLSKPPTADDE